MKFVFSVAVVFMGSFLVGNVHSEKLRIGVTHYNDILAQFQSFKETKNGIQPCEKSSDSGCIAGVARLMGHVKEIADNDLAALNYTSRLLLTPGNIISSQNGWSSLLQPSYSFTDEWERMGKTLKPDWGGYCYGSGCFSYWRPNVTSLGMDDFSGGLKNLTTFLTAAEIRPVVSNIDCDKLYSGDDEKNICAMLDRSSKITLTGFIEPNNVSYTIGVVGFVDPLTYHLADPGQLQFHNLESAIKNVIDTELMDVDFILALGTGSIETVKKVIDVSPKIKLVVYGGSEQESQEYPSNYGQTLILTAGKFGKSLGQLQLDVNMDDGSAALINSKLIVNNDAAPFNEDAEDEIISMAKAVADNAQKEIALLKVSLDGSSAHCKSQECALGNHIADAMVQCAFKNMTKNAPSELVAIWPTSGFAGSDFLEHATLNFGDTRRILQKNNFAVLVTITGKTLKEMFQISATGMGNNPSPDWGQFLHVSRGVQVKYQEYSDGTFGLESLQVLEKKGDSVTWLEQTEVADVTNYHVVIPSSIYNGRGAYYDMPGKFIGVGGIDKIDIAKDYVCVENYLMGLSVLGYNAEEDRIIITTSDQPAPTTTTSDNSNTASTSTSTTTTESGEQSNEPATTTTTTTTTVRPTTEKNSGPAVVCSTKDDKSTLQTALATAGFTTLFLTIILTLMSVLYAFFGWRYIGSHRPRQFQDDISTTASTVNLNVGYPNEKA